MDTLFLISLGVTAIAALFWIAHAIMWVFERITWNHLIMTSSLLITISLLFATGYAFWHTFGGWCIPLVMVCIAHGLAGSWMMFNSSKPSLNRPIFRVGGGHASPRLYR